MENLPNWVQALICMYLLGFGFTSFLLNAIVFSDGCNNLTRLIFGCVIEANHNTERYLNRAGVFIVTFFTVILTAPAIILGCFVALIILTAQIIWKCFIKLFAKKEKQDG